MNNKVNITLLISAFVVFAIAMVYGSYYIYTKNNGKDLLFSEYSTVLTSELNSQLDKQNEIDNKILDILSNGGYTFDNPCVLKNPYEISPLSALIIFNTEEETTINLTINDINVTTFESNTNHILPVVGLTNNSNNVIRLTNKNIETKEITIETDLLNEYLGDFEVKNYLGNKNNLMLLGDKNETTPYIRGFDHNNNLIYYLKLGNIVSANFYSESMQIVYNSLVINKNSTSGIKISIDYLGRINSISTATTDVIETEKVSIEDKVYEFTPINIYDTVSKNLEINQISDTITPTLPTTIKTDSLINNLKKSNDYKEPFELSLNGNFINFDFQSEGVKLLLVSKSNEFTYVYDLNKLSVIKTNLKGEYALYIIKDGTHYNLLTTLKL